jgi:hypothetical protein
MTGWRKSAIWLASFSLGQSTNPLKGDAHESDLESGREGGWVLRLLQELHTREYVLILQTDR